MSICAIPLSANIRMLLAGSALVVLAGALHFRVPGEVFGPAPGKDPQVAAVVTGTLEQASTAAGGAICALALTQDGTHLATGALTGFVSLWDVENLEVPLVQWQAHTEKVTAQAFAFSGHHLLTAGADQQLCKWHVAGSRLPQLVGQWKLSALATALALAADGATLAVAFGDRLELLQLNGDRLVPKSVLRMHRNPVRSLVFSPDGDRLAGGGGGDNIIRVWSINDAQATPGFTIEGYPDRWVRGLAYSADGATLVSLDTEGCVLAWNKEGRLIGEARAGQSPCLLAALSAGAQTIGTKTVCENAARLSRLPDHWWR